ARIRGCDEQSRRSALRHTARVCLRASRLRVPVSLRVCTLSRRTFMNNVGCARSLLSMSKASVPLLLTAETIAIGTELLIGGKSDSNSLFLADELGTLGIPVRLKSVVGDERPDIVMAIHTAVKRAQVIVMTGGLGPTVDDCTREAVAQATGHRLCRRKDALEGMTARLAQWGRRPNKGQLRQAMIPSGATVLKNPVGSAPGFCLRW